MTDLALGEWADEEVILTEEEAALEAEIARLRLIDPSPLKKYVDDFRDGTAICRDLGERGRRYYDGDQLDAPKLRALTRSRQPRVIRNEIKPAINGLLGVLQQARVDPKAFPRNPQNEEQADVATKALRYVGDKNKFHKTKIDVAENHLIEGIACAIVSIDANDDPLITRIMEDEWIYDPRARQADFADAAFKGVGKWMYEGDVAAMYPHFADDLSQSYTGTGWGGDMGLDRPDKPDQISTNWLDKAKRRLYLVELYHLEGGVWMRSVFYVGGVLEQDESPYLDDNNEPCCPIVMGSCFIDIDNQRYGLTRSMLSPQDELNAYSSRALHLANSRQIQVTDPNFPPDAEAQTAKVEAAKPDGALPAGWSVVPTQDLMQSIQLMIGDARQALVRQAPTPAVLSDASTASASGRAKLIQQQAGMTEIARALGRLEDWEGGVWDQVWLRLKQFKTEPWWVRITGAEGKQEFLPVNQPADAQGNPVPPEVMQAMQQQGVAPPQIMNNLATMDIDIEVETVPDTANLQAEQFEALSPMLPALAAAIGPEASFKVGLALSAISDKQAVRDIIEEAKGGDDPAAQQQAQMQQQMQQMQAELAKLTAEAKIRMDNAKADLTEAQARGTEADTVLKAAQFQMGQTIDAT